MKVNGKQYRTVWMEGSTVHLIELNLLPFEFRIHQCETYLETCRAIKTMIVRGAGAIGATAGYAMAQAFVEATTLQETTTAGSEEGEERDSGFLEFATKAKQDIENTRPTAQNLFYATSRVYKAAMNSKTPAQDARKEAQAVADEDAENCRLIGEYGKHLIQDGTRVETHCNAGWLAFVDHGSALSPIYAARDAGRQQIHVWVDETRPRSQGARLTAWELEKEGISHAILPDNAGAFYMNEGKVDLLIVGADRIAANGDVANKIGTLEKAIAAHYFGIPFYVAAPTSTIDLNCPSGKDIPIENRSPNEVLYQTGPSHNMSDNNTAIEMHTIRVASPNSSAENPAFDVTPAKLVKGIITEKGIIESPSTASIRNLLG